MESYWTRFTNQRMSRRRAVAAAAGVGLGLAALSALDCGGGSSGKTASNSAQLLGQAGDSTKNAVAGGNWPDYMPEDIVNMDPILNNASPTFPQLMPVYSNLFKAGRTVGKRPGTDAITGDAVETWEVAPDGMQITMKLRDLKWDPRPPTSGRALSPSDVKWSWDKFEALGNSGGELANSKSPDAPIASIVTPDARTVIFKMAFPYAAVIEPLSNSQNFYVMPQLENFNFKSDMRGTGPYFMDTFVPSQRITYRRNPDWYDKPRPYFDTIERTLISDYSTGLSQFSAKNIWQYAEVRPEDILSTKRSNPGMLLLANPDVAANATFVNFSKRDDSIFKDVRLRRAISMLLDRDLLLETFYNVKQFTDAGLPIQTYWHSHLAAGLPEWLDPRGKGLGEGAQYFQHNPAEAKKLVDASGLKTPVQTTLGVFTDNAQDEVKRNQTMAPMMSEGGIFDVKLDPLLYNTTWRTARQSAGMGFSGMLWHRAAQLTADIILNQKYTPNGRNSVSANPLPGITDLVAKQRQEIDPAKRASIVQQIERQCAIDFPDVSWAGDAPGFTLRWPWLANHGVFTDGLGGTARTFVTYWYDKSKQA
jgi:ABC-type transport system substrate-binding protein